ncbi:hypothetical protein SCHPADRAFT_934248 [Schizopora paradoxa]|uniref:Uncharacterized protein n=1 Tax=Schizopora paradoxa TaxID=27342 RepID=A0A0H2S808_9AGAM|nr:hypothetical protein SCHPADRAFT_934248 [Schizopora paradoxa]
MDKPTTTCPPQLNTDVSGIGVRVAFYLQALFMALLSAQSTSLEETVASLYTIVVTNLAMLVTAFTLGFKSEKEITLQDALIIIYLLAMSWVALYVAFPSYLHLRGDSIDLEILAILQSYLFGAFALAVFIDIKSFGSSPNCNPGAFLSILFIRVRAIEIGRVIFLAFILICLVLYTLMTFGDYVPTIKELWRWPRGTIGEAKDPHARLESDGRTLVDGEDIPPEKANVEIGWRLVQTALILIVWGVGVAHTELLIEWNEPEESPEEDTILEFAQMLQLFLVLIPLMSVVKMVHRHPLFRNDPNSPNRGPKRKDSLLSFFAGLGTRSKKAAENVVTRSNRKRREQTRKSTADDLSETQTLVGGSDS